MQRITSITRRDIKDILIGGIDINNGFTTFNSYYSFWGRLDTVDFMNRLYSLKDLPSKDSRYRNAEEDIYIHTITNPLDYDDDWPFSDDRFHIFTGSDEELLAFLCNIFHPEVRDESKDWRSFFDRINDLLREDKYELYPNQRISGRDVFGWRDLSATRFYRLKKEEIHILLNFFNRGGYVLNFTTQQFNDFTNDIVGVPLCTRYNLSKGKSLEHFVYDATENELIRLFKALMANYEGQNDLMNADQYKEQYIKCKEILSSIPVEEGILSEQAEFLKQKFSSDYLNASIQLMYQMQKDNPTEAIGKAKELIESCCETILEKYGLIPDKDWKLNQYVDETMKLLEITPRHIPDSAKEATAIKAILGSLKGIATQIAILRNAYGSGHGKSASYIGLQERHAKLAIGSSVTLVNYLWDSFERKYNA